MNRVGRFPTESEEFMKYSIHVTEAKNQEGNVRGFANLVFGDSFKITNIAILENTDFLNCRFKSRIQKMVSCAYG